MSSRPSPPWQLPALWSIFPSGRGGRSACSTSRCRPRRQRLAALARLHEAHPGSRRSPALDVEAALPDLENKTLVAGVLDRLQALGKLSATAAPSPYPAMNPSSARASEGSSSSWPQAIRRGGFSPPDVADLEGSAGRRAAVVPDLLTLLCDEQLAVEISPDLYLEQASNATSVAASSSGSRTARRSRCPSCASFLGTTRKYSVRSANTSTASASPAATGDVSPDNPTAQDSPPAEEASDPA